MQITKRRRTPFRQATASKRSLNTQEEVIFVESAHEPCGHGDPMESPTDIVRSDFDIYFSPQNIGSGTSAQFAQTFRELETEALQIQIQFRLPAPPPVTIYINSMGGELHAGLALHDILRGARVPVSTVVEGAAASAATLFSIAASSRSITKHSMMLIHQLSTGFMGSHQEFEEEMVNQTKMMDHIRAIYGQHTKLVTLGLLDSLLNADKWLTAEECLEYGLVDRILP